MAIRVSNDDKGGLRRLNERMNRKTRAAFAYVCEAGVSECKRRHGYTDRTGRLTASMGYVLKTPEAVKAEMAQGFNKAGDASSIAEGVKEGEAYAVSVASELRGARWGAAICAGASYARHVSERYSVLESALPIVQSLSKRLFNSLRNVDKD